ncbi:hypothetical protein H8B14_03375 [Hymenobacter sp. BT190]|nr:hypothetical protein [Hymenobacter sp. BT190]
MLVLKRLVTILVMVYVLLALLLVLSPGSRDGLMAVTAGSGNAAGFYYALFVIGAVLLLLQLITENLDSTLLRRNVAAHEGKINELKARLYDQQLEQRGTGTNAPRTGTTVHPEGYVVPAPVPPDAHRPTTRDEAPLA